MKPTSPDQAPDKTTPLPADNQPTEPYLRCIIGKLDLTLRPMFPAGSIVLVDITKRAVLPKENWTHAFQRPIYLLRSKEGYLCGWCEFDETSQWLTVIPHPQSSASSQRWRYQTEVENLGRVVGIVIGKE
jgi:hypothetical protein